MGTEVAMSFSALRAQLENEKSSLFKIDENIKKIQVTGRFPNDRFNNSSGDYSRGAPRLGGRNSFPEAGNNYNKNDEQFGKRKHETKIVFSRLSARVHDDDGEEEVPGIKKARVNSTVCRELPTRAAVLRAQGDDEQARKRNRRIFGSLLGTLQKFKQEEIVLQTKEDKKAQVEKKIEEQARQEKEREQRERKTLYAEREHKKATIKALEAKMARVQEFEKWEESQKHIANFILTKSKPHIYWLPKKMTDKATEKLNSSRKFQEKSMIKKRQELEEELQRIEQRCLRRGPAAKENLPGAAGKETAADQEQKIKEEGEGGRRRNKFAMDADEKEREDSDGDERHDELRTRETKVEKESDESKMDTSVDQDTTIEANTTMETEELTKSTNGQTSLSPEHSQHPENHSKPTQNQEDPESPASPAKEKSPEEQTIHSEESANQIEETKDKTAETKDNTEETKDRTEETKDKTEETKDKTEETKDKTEDTKTQEQTKSPTHDGGSET